jgi:hypothetical protein
MSIALERSYERTVWVKAPLRGLYREMCTADSLARFIPEIDRHRPGSDDSRAICSATISIGPLSYRVDGTLTVDRVVPLSVLRVELLVPSLQLSLRGTFDFTASAETETTLHYSATIRATHPLVRRLRSSLTGALEEHVDSTTDLISIRARQYAEAERRFAELEQSGNE